MKIEDEDKDKILRQLAIQSKENDKQTEELVIANNEITFQNEEKEKRAEELIVTKKEHESEIEESEKLVLELSNTNVAQELDITERKRIELEINLKNAELEKLNAEKDKFFSIIAHDLRGPFQGFLGFTDLLKTDINSMSKDELQETANNMFSSASNLFRLLTNLLEWSISQRGLTTFNPEKLSLKDISDDSLMLFNDVAKKKGIAIYETIPVGVFVLADKLMLNTIIRNLLSNSVKFTNKGGRVLISSEIKGDDVEISVLDTGIGMNEELIKNLFRLDIKTGRIGTNNEPSTGLGLLLCKEFVEKHNGKISVLSEVDKGSLITFNLPLYK